MGWFTQTFTSSIGKKLVMAVTGLCFCFFLAVHLLGNFMIYGGKETFNAYSERLHALGPLITAVELGLLFFALLHVSFAVLLYAENLRARPVRYAVRARAGGRTLSSMLMPYTGLYLLLFVLVHLSTFHFADRAARTIFDIAAQAFSSPWYVTFYVFSMVVAGLHVKHGFWSAFQTVGANHPKYMPIVRGASWVLSLILGAGFASIPLYILTGT
jgi:succinate dehydrogenase / fumarate reductase cytochrome b subunit